MDSGLLRDLKKQIYLVGGNYLFILREFLKCSLVASGLIICSCTSVPTLTASIVSKKSERNPTSLANSDSCTLPAEFDRYRKSILELSKKNLRITYPSDFRFVFVLPEQYAIVVNAAPNESEKDQVNSCPSLNNTYVSRVTPSSSFPAPHLYCSKIDSSGCSLSPSFRKDVV